MSEFIIQQGTDSGITWPVVNALGQPVDLTDYTGETQIRSFTNDKLIHTFSTDDNTMILGEGTVTLLWNNSETSAWNWKQANFGVELTNAQGKVARLIQGVVTLSKEVTK